MATTFPDPLATGGIRAPRRPRKPRAVTLLARRAVTHVHATAAHLSGSLLTAAGLACIDVGAFEANTVAGWIVTGVTVLLLDWKLDSLPPGGDR